MLSSKLKRIHRLGPHNRLLLAQPLPNLSPQLQYLWVHNSILLLQRLLSLLAPPPLGVVDIPSSPTPYHAAIRRTHTVVTLGGGLSLLLSLLRRSFPLLLLLLRLDCFLTPQRG